MCDTCDAYIGVEVLIKNSGQKNFVGQVKQEHFVNGVL